MSSISVLTFVFLFLLLPHSREKVRSGQPRRGNQAGPAERESEGGRMWWADADRRHKWGGGSSSVQIGWWEGRKEGGREGRKEGRRREVVEEGKWEEGGGYGGGGGGGLSAALVWIWRRGSSQSHFSPLLSSPIPPYPPRDRREGEREGTVSMATAEQR